MKHVTFSDKSLLVGDDVAGLLLEYGAELGNRSKADTVTVHAFGADGSEVEATFLLNEGANLMAESVSTSMSPPDNTSTLAYLRDQLDKLRNPPMSGAADDFEGADASDFDY